MSNNEESPRTCMECSGSMEGLSPKANYCSAPCRMAFNNRRRDRGAELYDLMMVQRYQRPLAKSLHLLSVICRLCKEWRADDVAHRDGRPSWGDTARALGRHGK